MPAEKCLGKGALIGEKNSGRTTFAFRMDARFRQCPIAVLPAPPHDRSNTFLVFFSQEEAEPRDGILAQGGHYRGSFC
jgi:hypothetical protein